MSASPDKSPPQPRLGPLASILLGVVALAGMALLYVLLAQSGLVELLSDKAGLRTAIDRLGAWGPAAIVALEALAIVASPLPSAPVALAAGALYGTTWGAVLTIAGAVLGAVVAFCIARCFGFEAIRRLNVAQKYLDMLSQHHSQRWLMGAVFLSRLLPFVSFDAVSYLAGLTPLAFWRFALSTFTGVIPVAFALTYTGETMVSASADLVLAVIAGLVAMPFVAAGIRALWRAWR